MPASLPDESQGVYGKPIGGIILVVVLVLVLDVALVFEEKENENEQTVRNFRARSQGWKNCFDQIL